VAARFQVEDLELFRDKHKGGGEGSDDDDGLDTDEEAELEAGRVRLGRLLPAPAPVASSSEREYGLRRVASENGFTSGKPKRTARAVGSSEECAEEGPI
jgi:hypothetical protein